MIFSALGLGWAIGGGGGGGALESLGPLSFRLMAYLSSRSPSGSLYLRMFVASGFAAAIGGGGGASGFFPGAGFSSFMLFTAAESPDLS